MDRVKNTCPSAFGLSRARPTSEQENVGLILREQRAQPVEDRPGARWRVGESETGGWPVRFRQ